MAESSSKEVTAIVHVQKSDEIEEQEEKLKPTKITGDSQEEVDESSDEEFVPEEEEDSENEDVKKNEGEDKEKKEDEGDSCSSGEEEEGVNVDVVKIGGQKFFKLKFADVEQKRKEFVAQMQQEEESDNEEEQDSEKAEEVQEEATTEPATEPTENKENLKPSFKEYRTETILDEDMDYKSDEDDNFNPIYCGETLSDVEYEEGDERDTESEPETEPMEGTHKKTGETLVCIKMIEQLQIPQRDQPCSPNKFTDLKPTDQPMECT